MGLFVNHIIRVMWVNLQHSKNCITPWELCMGWMEHLYSTQQGRTSLNKEGPSLQPWAATFHKLYHSDCKAQITQGLFAIGHSSLLKKEGIFNSPSPHCSWLLWLSEAEDKLIWEEKTPVHTLAATLEMILSVHFFFFFLHSHICSTGLPPAGTRRIFCGFIFPFLHFFFNKVIQSTMFKEKQC